MILRGLIVAFAGFLFIFSPGVPIGLLSRRVPQVDRGLMYWGLGVWLVTLLPGLFLQSLLRQVLYGGASTAQLAGGPLDYVATLLGALVSALLLHLGMYLVLRWRKRGGVTPADGLAIGFGVGLIAQVFTGLSLVGAGFNLMFGVTDTAALVSMSEAGVLPLIFSLVPLILFRLALLAVSAATGVLVARAVSGQMAALWIAVVVYGLFVWAILAIQIAFGTDSPGLFIAGEIDPLPTAVTIGYYIAMFALAYAWVSSALRRSATPP